MSESWKHNALTMNAEELCEALRAEGRALAEQKRRRAAESGTQQPDLLLNSNKRTELNREMHKFAVSHVQKKLEQYEAGLAISQSSAPHEVEPPSVSPAVQPAMRFQRHMVRPSCAFAVLVPSIQNPEEGAAGVNTKGVHHAGASPARGTMALRLSRRRSREKSPSVRQFSPVGRSSTSDHDGMTHETTVRSGEHPEADADEDDEDDHQDDDISQREQFEVVPDLSPYDHNFDVRAAKNCKKFVRTRRLQRMVAAKATPPWRTQTASLDSRLVASESNYHRSLRANHVEPAMASTVSRCQKQQAAMSTGTFTPPVFAIKRPSAWMSTRRSHVSNQVGRGSAAHGLDVNGATTCSMAANRKCHAPKVTNRAKRLLVMPSPAPESVTPAGDLRCTVSDSMTLASDSRASSSICSDTTAHSNQSGKKNSVSSIVPFEDAASTVEVHQSDVARFELKGISVAPSTATLSCDLRAKTPRPVINFSGWRVTDDTLISLAQLNESFEGERRRRTAERDRVWVGAPGARGTGFSAENRSQGTASAVAAAIAAASREEDRDEVLVDDYEGFDEDCECGAPPTFVCANGSESYTCADPFEGWLDPNKGARGTVRDWFTGGLQMPALCCGAAGPHFCQRTRENRKRGGIHYDRASEMALAHQSGGTVAIRLPNKQVASRHPKASASGVSELCHDVGKRGLQSIIKSCRQLKSIDLSACTHLQNFDIDALQSKRLRSLAIQGNNSSKKLRGDKAVVKLLENCPRLTTLALRGWSTLTDQGIPKIAAAAAHGEVRVWPQASVNCVSGRSRSRARHEVYRHGWRLKRLEITGPCPLVSDCGLLALLEAGGRRGLRAIRLRHCESISDLFLQGFQPVSAVAQDAPSSTNIGHADEGTCEGGVLRPPLLSSCHWRRCSPLLELDLQGCVGIRDTGLSVLAQGCPSLRVLNLRGCVAITDLGIASLANCATGDGENSSAPESGPPVLAMSLRRIDVSGCPLIGDDGWLAFFRVSIDRSHGSSGRDSSGLVAQSACTGPTGELIELTYCLRRLSLRGCTLCGDATLRAIAERCPALATLDARGLPRVGDLGIRAICRAAAQKGNALRRLALSARESMVTKNGDTFDEESGGGLIPRVNLAGFAALGWLPPRSMRALRLSKTKLNDACLHAFLPRMCGGLDSSRHNVPKHSLGVKDIFGEPRLLGGGLTALDISGCVGITDSSLELIGRCVAALRHDLNVDAARLAVSDGSCFSSSALPLTSLNLSDVSPTDVTDRGVLALMHGFALAAARDLNALTSISGGCSPGLRRLELGGLPRLTDAAVIAISQAAGPTLMHLNLRGCVEITDRALEALSTVEKMNGPGSCSKLPFATAGSCLQYIDLRACSNVTIGGVQCLVRGCKEMLSVRMSSGDFSEASIASLVDASDICAPYASDIWPTNRMPAEIGTESSNRFIASILNHELTSDALFDATMQLQHCNRGSVAMRLAAIPQMVTRGRCRGFAPHTLSVRIAIAKYRTLTRHTAAAAVLQRIWRGALGRRAAEMYFQSARKMLAERKCKAAMRMQALCRGARARVLVSRIRRIKLQYEQQRALAARSIQTMYRVKIERARFMGSSRASIGADLDHDINFEINIQRGEKYDAEQTLARLLHIPSETNNLLAQIVYRARIVKARKFLGALCFQRICRGIFGRKKALLLRARRRSQALLAQRLTRGHFARVRAQVLRLELLVRAQAAAYINKICRGWIGRQHHRNMYQAYTVASAAIQRIWRGSHYRMSAHCKRMCILKATMFAQRNARQVLWSLAMRRKTAFRVQQRILQQQSASKIQGAWAHHVVLIRARRKRMREIMNATWVIANIWRRYRHRLRATLLMQRTYRGRLGRRRADLQKEVMKLFEERRLSFCPSPQRQAIVGGLIAPVWKVGAPGVQFAEHKLQTCGPLAGERAGYGADAATREIMRHNATKLQSRRRREFWLAAQGEEALASVDESHATSLIRRRTFARHAAALRIQRMVRVRVEQIWARSKAAKAIQDCWHRHRWWQTYIAEKDRLSRAVVPIQALFRRYNWYIKYQIEVRQRATDFMRGEVVKKHLADEEKYQRFEEVVQAMRMKHALGVIERGLLNWWNDLRERKLQEAEAARIANYLRRQAERAKARDERKYARAQLNNRARGMFRDALARHRGQLRNIDEDTVMPKLSRPKRLLRDFKIFGHTAVHAFKGLGSNKVKGVHEGAWKHEHDGDEIGIIKGSVNDYQTRNRVKFGVIELHITHGIDERVKFQDEQDRINSQGRPFYVMCEPDLAGPCDLTRERPQLWQLWKMFGEGDSVLSELKVVQRPVGGVKTQQQRIDAMLEEGIIVVPKTPSHDGTKVPPWEFNCSRYSSKVALPIKDVEVAHNAEAVQRLERRGYSKLLPSLGHYGGDFADGVFIMVQQDRARKPYTMKKAQGVSKTHGYGADTIADVYTEELGRTMEFAGLAEEEVIRLHTLFRKMDICSNGEVWRDDIADYFCDQPDVTDGWVRELFRLVDADPDEALTFPQFAHLVVVFCLMEKREVYHLMYNLCEHGERDTIGQENLRTVIEQLGRGSDVIKKAHVVRCLRAFPRYALKTARDRMDRKGFARLLASFPTLAWPIERMQLELQRHALGEHYWVEKKKRFMRGRQLVDRDTAARKTAFYEKHRVRLKTKKRGLFHKLNPADEKIVLDVLESVGAKSSLATRFRAHWRKMPHEQQKNVIETMRKVTDQESRITMLKVAVHEEKELEKAPQRAQYMTERQKQLSRMMRSSSPPTAST